jgi:hypothetical protein
VDLAFFALFVIAAAEERGEQARRRAEETRR